MGHGKVADLRSIVAVPGFAVHPEASWTCNDNGFNWLRDADGLQKEFPLCRILLYQYNSRHRGPHKVDKPLKDIASEFVFELQAERVVGIQICAIDLRSAC